MLHLEEVRQPGDLRRLASLGLPDRFIEHGETGDQWQEAGIDVATLVRRAEELAYANAEAGR